MTFGVRTDPSARQEEGEGEDKMGEGEDPLAMDEMVAVGPGDFIIESEVGESRADCVSQRGAKRGSLRTRGQILGLTVTPVVRCNSINCSKLGELLRAVKLTAVVLVGE